MLQTPAICAALWLTVTPALAVGRKMTVCTPPLVPDASGLLQCKVVATSRLPIGMAAHIVADDGADVTQFSTGFRASPEVTGDGFYAEETAGSFADDARFCRTTISAVQLESAVRVSLVAFDPNGNATATVEVTDTGHPRRGASCPERPSRGGGNHGPKDSRPEPGRAPHGPAPRR